MVECQVPYSVMLKTRRTATATLLCPGESPTTLNHSSAFKVRAKRGQRAATEVLCRNSLLIHTVASRSSLAPLRQGQEGTCQTHTCASVRFSRKTGPALPSQVQPRQCQHLTSLGCQGLSEKHGGDGGLAKHRLHKNLSYYDNM
ncbi:hypothetical protein AOLI_G00025760 [Acnodon oligacanthus]